ncbi:MAG: sugar ABC transporter substrate-binding protein [Limnochordales bacterium]|nr:sugar ABC transporter substrate-binding protein [Limnochordales bacterium]
MSTKIMAFLMLALLSGTVMAAELRESVTITWLCWGGPEVIDRNQRIVEAFYRRYPDLGVKVKSTVLGWDDYVRKLPVMIASGAELDVIAVEGTYMFPSLAAGGALADLSVLASKYRDEFFPGSLDSLTRDGKVLGIPMMGWESAPALFIVYNKDLFDQAGVAYPSYEWTWDHFIELGKKLTRGDPGREKWAMDWGQSDFFWYWYNLIHAFGGWVYNADHTASEVNSKEAVAAITLLNDFRVKYKISTYWGDWDAFDQGRSAMTARWDTEAQKMLERGKARLGVAIFPAGPAGNGFHIYTRRAASGAAHSLALFKGSKHPNEALRFIDFLVSDPEALRAEGTNWPWVPLRRNIPVFLNIVKDSTSWMQVFRAITEVHKRILLVDRAEGFGPDAADTQRIMAENLRRFYSGEVSAQGALDTAKKQIDAVLSRQRLGK